MIPVIALDEDRDVWFISEWRYEDYVPALKPAPKPVLQFPECHEELMRANLLVA